MPKLDDLDAAAGVGAGMVVREAGAEGRHPGARLRQGHAGPEPPHRHHAVVPPVVPVRLGERQREPHVAAAGGELERRRHDADHRVGAPVQRDLASDDVRIAAEPARPQAVAEHRDAVAARLVLMGKERPPQEGLHAEGPEEVGRHRDGVQELGAAGRRGQPRHAVEVAGQRLEDVAAFLPVDVVARRDQERGRRIGLLHGHQPVRLGVRQRPQQHGVHEAEDGPVRADPDPQREDDDEAEARAPQQAPRRVPHVAENRFEHGKPRLVPERLPNLRYPAELRAGQPSGLGGGLARADVLGGEQVEVHLDLLLRLPREAAAREQVPHARHERDYAAPGAHGSGDSRRRRAMTPAMRSQSSVWAASRRRPAAVMA